MATNTTNYGWTKPDYEDDADIAVLNETFDAIDAQVKTVETALNSKQNALSSAQLAAVNSGIDSAKVEQIETNKNNILIITPVTNTVLFGVSETNTYEQASDLDVTLPAGKTIMITASAVYADGIVLSVGTSYTTSVIGINDSNPDDNLNLNVSALFKNRDNTAKTVKTYVKRSSTAQYAVSTWYTIV